MLGSHLSSVSACASGLQHWSLVDPALELINIVSSKVADDSINVADTVNVGEEIARHLVNSLPEGSHKSISGEIKTMETMKRE